MAATGTFPSLKAFFLTLFIIVVFVLIASYVLTMLMGFGLIFLTPNGFSLSMRLVSPPVYLFLFFGFNAPAIPVGALFLAIWIVYVICFMMAWKWRENFHITVEKSFSRPLRSIFNNFLLAMPLISSMVLTAATAIIYSQEAVGIPTGQASLPPNPYETLLNLAYSPVVEEIGFRLVPIGFFIVLFVFLARKNSVGLSTGGDRLKLFLTALIYPEGAKKMVGLKTVREHGVWKGISLGEWIMIVVTSVIFGVAHVISGIGWEIGKVTSVFVQGFFFGLTYIAYGFEAPILLHWFFDYYFFFFEPDIANQFFPTTIGMLSTIESVTLILGVLGWIAFATLGLSKLLQPKRVEEAPFPPTTPFTAPS